MTATAQMPTISIRQHAEAIGRLDYPADKLQPFGRDHLSLCCRLPNDISESNINQMRLTACAKEPWTIAAIEAMQPGEIMWDIGACVGSYTLVAAARGHLVVAFEPVESNYHALITNVLLNNLSGYVIPQPVALANDTGHLILHQRTTFPGSAANTLEPHAKHDCFHRYPVSVWKADVLAELLHLPLPHLVKLDVDGAEAQVLAGMAGILATPPAPPARRCGSR